MSQLSKHLADTIRISGPMSIAHYMRQVLTNPISGYYMKGDIFGTKGDFITSPEISQMFGELVGIWLITEWMRQGKPQKVRLVEFGPGRGTLMDDALRAISQFKEFASTIESVNLIEASPHMRRNQFNTLCDPNEQSSKPAYTSSTMYSNEKQPVLLDALSKQGPQIKWLDGIEELDDGIFTLVTAHEFFDAMPIHKFEKTEQGWRELMVDLDDSEDSAHNFRIILHPKPTSSSMAYTSHLLFSQCQVGDRIEVSPDSWVIANRIAGLLKRNGGSGLIIDYGGMTGGDTLRAIKSHQIVHPMSNPGTADLSADVDFEYIKDASKAEGVQTFGPITQSHFLHSLGIELRLKKLLENAADERRQKVLFSSYERLVDERAGGMGKVYKAFAISPYTSNNSVPVAFGVNP